MKNWAIMTADVIISQFRIYDNYCEPSIKENYEMAEP